MLVEYAVRNRHNLRTSRGGDDGAAGSACAAQCLAEPVAEPDALSERQDHSLDRCRNTIGVVVPLAGGLALGAAPVGIALATGAMNVSYSDSHDPYLLRWRKMLAASFLVGLAVFAGALCGRNHLLAALIAGIWAFGSGMMVALTTTAADLGVISLVTLIVYSAVPQTPDRAIYAGLLAFGGGLFQTLLSVAFWPLRRYSAESRAIGQLYLELSRMAAMAPEVLQAPPASGTITQAQNTLSGLDLDHSVPAERYRSLLNQAERIRLSLLLLGRLRVRIAREHVEGLPVDILDAFFAACSAHRAGPWECLIVGRTGGDCRRSSSGTGPVRGRFAAVGAQIGGGGSAGSRHTPADRRADRAVAFGRGSCLSHHAGRDRRLCQTGSAETLAPASGRAPRRR